MTPNQTEWRVGDWCFYAFTLCQVSKVETDGRVTKLTSGNTYYHYHPTDLRGGMFPLSHNGDYLRQVYADQAARLRSKTVLTLAWPAISSWLEREWVTAMRLPATDDTSRVRRLYAFADAIEKLADSAAKLDKMGLKIFQPL